jgi:hypothetical protein
MEYHLSRFGSFSGSLISSALVMAPTFASGIRKIVIARSLARGMQKSAEESALNSPSEIDTRSFMWTFASLDEDHELERFFAGLPGLRSSKLVSYPVPSLTLEQKWELCQALTGLLDRTFTSDLLPTPVKNRRAILCAKAVDPVYFPHAFSVLDKILYKCQYRGPLATGIVEIVRGWPTRSSLEKGDILYTRAIASMIVARVQPHDGTWFILASNELGIPEAVLRDYAHPRRQLVTCHPDSRRSPAI